MKVKELIGVLNTKNPDAGVFYPSPDYKGLHEVTRVKTAFNSYDELKEIVGDEFVLIYSKGGSVIDNRKTKEI